MSPTPLSPYDREWLNKLLSYVNEIRGIDYSLYRYATVVRKLELRIEETRTGHYRDYLDYLKTHPEELDLLIKAVSIKVSSFFRNPLVYEILGSIVLPELMAEFGFLKAWSLGCAHGEEPYSLAMIARELQKGGRAVDIRILGTDICDGAIERSFEGAYPEESLGEVKKKYLDSCFELVPQRGEALQGQERVFRISNDIKALVRLECGDVPSRLQQSRRRGDRFNLILCRNVLIYMNKTLQAEVVGLIAGILHENGYLVIGETETIPFSSRASLMQPFPGVKIFKKKSLTAGIETT